MARESLRAGVLQLESGNDVESNLRAVRSGLGRAYDLGAQLVVLPENFAYFGPEANKQAHAESLGHSGPIQDELREACVKHGLYVIAGGMPEKSDEASRPYNTSAVFDPSGQLIASYRKIHLFDVDLPDGRQLREGSGTKPGDEVVLVEILGFKVGLAICYDLRFPDLFRKLTDRGACVLTVPAAFTEQTGKDHWHVLLRARAIEGQCYVLAAAQWGRHPKGRRSYGHALIADPWGTVIAECSNSVGVQVADLSRSYLEQVRANLPCLSHRRELD